MESTHIKRDLENFLIQGGTLAETLGGPGDRGEGNNSRNGSPPVKMSGEQSNEYRPALSSRVRTQNRIKVPLEAAPTLLNPLIPQTASKVSGKAPSPRRGECHLDLQQQAWQLPLSEPFTQSPWGIKGLI